VIDPFGKINLKMLHFQGAITHHKWNLSKITPSSSLDALLLLVNQKTAPHSFSG
jgi:hypothetical protein